MIKPGNFGNTVLADTKRLEFDFGNEQILYLNKRPDIVFIGDSITDLWELNAYFGDGKFIVNRGIGGDTSDILVKRFDADALQLNPKMVVVLIGFNDISRFEDDLWWRTKGEDINIVMQDIKNNFIEIVKKCSKTDVKLAICSLLPSNTCKPFKNEQRKEIVIEINEFVKNLCNENQLIYVDFSSHLCESDGKTLIYNISPDGVHINGAGYEIMAGVLKEYLQ